MQHAHRGRRKHGEQEEGYRRAAAQVAAVHALEEREAGQHLRGVEGPAAGEDVDDDHVGEGEDEPEQGRHEGGRQHQRDGDLEHVAEEPGAVHLRGVVDVLRDAGQASEQDDGGERERAPDLHGDDGDHGQLGLSEPDGPGGGPEDVQVAQRPVDHAVDGVEDPQPPDGAQRDGRHPRQEDEQPHQPLAAELALQCDGQHAGQHQDQDLRDEGEEDGVAQRAAEARVAQRRLEVLQPDEVEAVPAQRDAGQAVDDGQHERPAHQERDVEDGRRQ